MESFSFLHFIFLIIISLLPVAVLLWYFDRFDSMRKESRKFLWKIFSYGIAITLAAAGIEMGLMSMFMDLFTTPLAQLLVLSFVFIAAVEEALKYWVIKKKAYESTHFDEHIDGIIYGVTASLGFAALENILYVVQGGVGVGILRAFTAVPAHALFGAIMGYYISVAKFSKTKELKKKNLRKGLLLAVFFHGLYDFLLLAPTYINGTFLVIFVIPLLLGLYVTVKRKLWKMQHLDNLPKSFEVKKWTVKRYITYILGLIIISWSVISAANFLLFYAGDQSIVEEFSAMNVDPASGLLFSGLLFIGSFFLLREKRPSKK